MRVVKYFLGVFLILAGLGSFFKSDFISGVLVFILGLILIPPIAEKIKNSFNSFKNKYVRYVTYLMLFAIAGSFMSKKDFEDSKQNTIKPKSNTIPNDGQQTQKIKEYKAVKWKNEFSKKEILGQWLQEKYYHENQKATYLKNGDPEQKLLILSKSKYQTSYPYGNGKNKPFNYNLNGNHLSVVTGKLNIEIYSFRVFLSEDKSTLLLKEKSGLYQVFNKKRP